MVYPYNRLFSATKRKETVTHATIWTIWTNSEDIMARKIKGHILYNSTDTKSPDRQIQAGVGMLEENRE